MSFIPTVYDTFVIKKEKMYSFMRIEGTFFDLYKPFYSSSKH